MAATFRRTLRAQKAYRLVTNNTGRGNIGDASFNGIDDHEGARLVTSRPAFDDFLDALLASGLRMLAMIFRGRNISRLIFITFLRQRCARLIITIHYYQLGISRS